MENPPVKKLNSWKSVREFLIKRRNNTPKENPKVFVPEDCLRSPTDVDMFQYSDNLSYDPDTELVFRDNRETDSLQVRILEEEKIDLQMDVYEVQLDSFNPAEGRIIGHIVTDIKNAILD